MAVKQKNTKKKMALLGLKKDKDGDYRYIDPDDTTSEFVPVSGITLIEGRIKKINNNINMKKEVWKVTFIHPLCIFNN